MATRFGTGTVQILSLPSGTVRPKPHSYPVMDSSDGSDGICQSPITNRSTVIDTLEPSTARPLGVIDNALGVIQFGRRKEL